MNDYHIENLSFLVYLHVFSNVLFANSLFFRTPLAEREFES